MANTSIPQSNNSTKDSKTERQQTIREIIKAAKRMNHTKRTRFMEYLKPLAIKFGQGSPLRQQIESLQAQATDPD